MIFGDTRGCRMVKSTTLLAWVVGCTTGAALVLTACTPGTTGSPSSRASATTRATTPISSAEQAKQDALAAYLGMWQDFVVAGRTSDWQSPTLGDHATGLALQSLSRGLYSD